MSKKHEVKHEKIASVQIDKAIDCYLESTLGGYICATTLAGASEGMLGELLLSHHNKVPAMEETVLQVLNNNNIVESDKNFRDLKKQFIGMLNHPKNMYKHFNIDHCEKDFDPHLYAEMMINRAILNYGNLTNSITPKMDEFLVLTKVKRDKK